MSDHQKTILIIDDDPAILRVLTRVLERKGYAVTAAKNGKEALEQINHRRFNAALIDVRLPDMEGTALLPCIEETSPKTVKIVFTGSPTAELSENPTKNHMDAFLLKPVKPEIILGILDEKLNGH
jgi:DNA-binding NtrC family response regulator